MSVLLVSKMYSEFSIECSACLLETEVVVEAGICEVFALQGYVVATIADGVGESHVVGELCRHHIVVFVCADA